MFRQLGTTSGRSYHFSLSISIHDGFYLMTELLDLVLLSHMLDNWFVVLLFKDINWVFLLQALFG